MELLSLILLTVSVGLTRVALTHKPRVASFIPHPTAVDYKFK